MVAVRGLTKHYNSGSGPVTALDGVSFEIREGEFVSVQGPSGCGKSTLLALLGLLEAADAGSYELAGSPVAHLSFSQRAEVRNRHIGLIFQAFNIIGDMTVMDNVALPLRYNRAFGRSSREELALHYLDRVGMANRARSFPSELSGGQQQRVAIARALVTRPSLLLADEPTGNLDSRNATEVMNLLSELNAEGATILLVTHAPEFAEAASRTIRLLDGRLVGQVEAAHQVRK